MDILQNLTEDQIQILKIGAVCFLIGFGYLYRKILKLENSLINLDKSLYGIEIILDQIAKKTLNGSYKPPKDLEDRKNRHPN